MIGAPVLPREEFAALEHRAYLDTASVGLPSRSAVRAVASAYDVFARLGSGALGAGMEMVERTRHAVAGLVGSTADQIAFARSTTDGLGAVARGLGLGPGDRVLVPAGEFPSVALPFTDLRTDGVDVVEVGPAPGSGAVDVETYRRAIADGPVPRLVVAAWVGVGQAAVDLAALAEVVHGSGALLCVDAVQGLGVLPAHLDAWQVDVAVANAHKWLLAGPGAAVVHVRSDVVEQIRPSAPGWLTGGDRAGSRFEGGTPDIPAIAALGASAEMLLAAGPDRIHRHVLTLRGTARAWLREAGGLPEDDPTGSLGPSGVLAFRTPGVPAEVLARHCAEARVDLRIGRERHLASLHGFTDLTDVTRLAGAVAAASADPASTPAVAAAR